MATLPMFDPITDEPMLTADEEPLICEPDEVCCPSDSDVVECDPGSETVTVCDDGEGTDLSTLEECFYNMFKVLELDFNSTPTATGNAFLGPCGPDGLDGLWYTETLSELFPGKPFLTMLGNICGNNFDQELLSWAGDFTFQCIQVGEEGNEFDHDIMKVFFRWGETTTPFTVFSIKGIIHLPFDFFNGAFIDMENAPEHALPLGEPCFNVDFARLYFYGPPCVPWETAPCIDPAVVTEFSYIQRTRDVLAECDDFLEEDEVPTCEFDITFAFIAGRCPIIACIWSDGYSASELGCERTYKQIGNSCGINTENLTVWLIDESGCIIESDPLILVCCQCCPPVGEGVFFTLYDPPGPEEACDPVSVEICGFIFCHAVCRYEMVLGNITVTDCYPETEVFGFWFVEWDGLPGLDGEPLEDGCYPIGAIFHIRHDAGGLGSSHCPKFTPFDSRGCSGDPHYEPFKTGDSTLVCPPEEEES